MKLSLLDDNGNVIETFDLADYDLTKQIARLVLLDEITTAMRRATRDEIDAVNSDPNL